MYSGPVHIQVNGGRRGDPRLPFLINRGRVLLGPMLRHAEARGALGVQNDRYTMEDGSYVDAIASPYVNVVSVNLLGAPPEGEPGEKGEVEKWPLSFVGALMPVDTEGAPLTDVPFILDAVAWHYHESISAGDPPQHAWAHWAGAPTYIWAGDGKYPCGNHYWYLTREVEVELGVFERQVTHVVSWAGPHEGLFAPMSKVRSLPRTSDFIAIAPVDENVPPNFMYGAGDIYGAFIHDGNVSYIDYDDDTKEMRMLKTRGPGEDGFAEWDVEWTTTLPSYVDHIATHFYASLDATECRVIAREKIEAFTELVELPDNNQRYLPECYSNVELIVDTATGGVTEGHRDKDDFPKTVAKSSDWVEDSVPPSRTKEFYVRQEYVPDGQAASQLLDVYHSDSGTTKRYPLPYVGEQYDVGSGHIFTVIDVTPVDPLPAGVQESQRASELEAMTSEELELNHRANGLAEPQLREDEFGRSATIEVTWDAIDTDMEGDPVPILAGSPLTSRNTSGVAHMRWHRKMYGWHEGSNIVGSRFDEAGELVQVFMESDLRYTFVMHVGAGVGIYVPSAAELQAECDLYPTRYDDTAVAAFAPVELVDYSSSDAPPSGADHDAYTNAHLLESNRLLARVTRPNAAAEDEFYRLVDYQVNSGDIRLSSGFTGDASWSGDDWSTYTRDIAERKQYQNANGEVYDVPDVESPDPREVSLAVDTTVEYFDPVGGLLVTTSVDDARFVDHDTSSASLDATDYGVSPIDSIPGATGAGPPDYLGQRTLASSPGTEFYTQAGRRWDNFASTVLSKHDRQVYGGEYFAEDGYGASDGSKVSSVWGTLPDPGPLSRVASVVLGVSMRETQTTRFDPGAGERAGITTHWPAFIPLDSQNRPVLVGAPAALEVNRTAFANGAADFTGAAVASVYNDEKGLDTSPASTSYSRLFGDPTDNFFATYEYTFPAEDYPEGANATDYWLKAMQVDYPCEVYYGAKPWVREEE